MMKFNKIAMGTALAAVSLAALATVTFDTATGWGFVGKGDVQTLYGWNNQKAQQYSTQVSFSYNTVETYDAECTWETVTGKGKIIYHLVPVTRTNSVNASVASDPRKTGQWTGWNLKGWNGTPVITGGSVPQLGDPCPGVGWESSGNETGEPGTITLVTQTSSSGGLYVTFGGVSYLLTISVPLI